MGHHELLGADVGLSSKKLLNVATGGIEDRGKVSGSHLDCAFSSECED